MLNLSYGINKVDHSLAVTTTWSISTRCITQYDMYHFNISALHDWGRTCQQYPREVQHDVYFVLLFQQFLNSTCLLDFCADFASTFFLLTTESFDRSHFRPNSSEINREHSTNTMELVNISQTGGPVNNYVQLGITLKEMGLKVVKCLTTSEVTNPTALEPDEFHSFAVENNMPVYWLMLTVEEFNSLITLTNTGENKLLPTISGATRMPAFDKVIFNMSPQLAATTLVYHQTEGHCSTAETTQWILLSFQQDHQQNQLRLANGAITVFNRGYVAPQMQLPWNRTLRFNNYELSTQQSWVITTTSETTSLLWTVHDRLSWKHNILWTFNVPVDASKVINTDDNEWPQVVQALAYTGLQALDHFDDDVNKRIKGLLTQSHPLIQQRSMLNTSNIHWHGA